MMSPKQERRTTARLIVANVQAADAPQSRLNVQNCSMPSRRSSNPPNGRVADASDASPIHARCRLRASKAKH
jgi:hypothetical protein